jgi:hypothetical protein
VDVLISSYYQPLEEALSEWGTDMIAFRWADEKNTERLPRAAALQ